MKFSYPRLHDLSVASIDTTTTGDNTIVSGVADKRIIVHRIWFVCGGSTNITFKHGSTAFNGAANMSTNGGLTFDATGEPWFVTGKGEDFIINQSGTAQIGGMVYYTIV